MSSAPLSATSLSHPDCLIYGGTRESTNNYLPRPQIQQATCSHRLADPSAPCTNTRLFRLHIPVGRPESHEEILGCSVQMIGDHPVTLGGYSDIWKGWLKTCTSLTYELVAVKVLRHFGGNANHLSFAKHLQREVRIWLRLDHENIAHFHGVVYHSDDRPAMISPWYSNGSADVYLRNHPSADPMKMISEITSGVEYLHSHGVVHGDLKGANVLVDDSGHAKLIDFGLSRLLETVVGPSGFTLSTMSFSIRWCAPELLRVENAQVTTATDVYSWASTTLQLLTGDVPYSSHREVTVFVMILHQLPPQRPMSPLRYSINNVDTLWDLLGACWAEEPYRPSISEVKDRLRPFYS